MKRMRRFLRRFAAPVFATRASLSVLVMMLPLIPAVSCIQVGQPIKGTQTFSVVVTKVNGADPPTLENALPANIGDHDDVWDVDIEALNVNGDVATDFNGYVQVSVTPGAVKAVSNDLTPGDISKGHNLLLQAGKASAKVTVTATFGPTHLLVEDVGYVPAPAGQVPQCSDGKNNDPNEDSLIDFPNDPGCYAANDDTETGGTYTGGSSEAVNYLLPTVRQVRGIGATTPYLYDAVQVKADSPQELVVTRVAKDGFYVTDLADQGKGYNSLFAFNFSTPADMEVCDRVTYLAGTAGEFFGFMELNFPSYRVTHVHSGQNDLCPVPEPQVLDDATVGNGATMEKFESALVRIEGYSLPTHFGAGLVVNNAPKEGASNCDLNGDGTVDFASADEGACSTACDNDANCSEWTEYLSRGNYKVHDAAQAILINTSQSTMFDPAAGKGATLDSVTGTLRDFSGGNFNFTVEIRCTDDLICSLPGCTQKVVDSKHACAPLVLTSDDNDEGSN